MAIPIYVPDLEGLVGKLAPPDDGLRISGSKHCLQIVWAVRARAQDALDQATEFSIAGRVCDDQRSATGVIGTAFPNQAAVEHEDSERTQGATALMAIV